MDPIVEKLNQFSIDDWCGWFDRFLLDETPEPEISYLGEEKCESLIRLYRALSKAARVRFAAAVVRSLECTEKHPEQAERLYVFLQLVAYIQPIGAKSLVRGLLKNPALKTMSFARQKLQIVALVTASKFDMDDDLLYDMDRSAAQISEFRELLVYLRIFSQASAARAAHFLSRLIDKLEPGVKIKQAIRQIQGVVLRNGCKEIFLWYEQERQRSSPTFDLFSREVLRQVVPPPGQWRNQSDDYAILLSAVLYTVDSSFSHDDLILFSEVAKRVRGDTAGAVSFVRSTQQFHIVDSNDPGIERIPMKKKNHGLQLITREDKTRIISEAEAEALTAT